MGKISLTLSFSIKEKFIDADFYTRGLTQTFKFLAWNSPFWSFRLYETSYTALLLTKKRHRYWYQPCRPHLISVTGIARIGRGVMIMRVLQI